MQLNEAQIKHMVDKFLAWKIVQPFRPDGGISFESTYRGVGGVELPHEPTGTNLFDANQTEEMIRHITKDLPD